jgi:hypothetical protein
MDFKFKRIKKLIPYSTAIIIFTLVLMAINQNLIIFGVLFFIFGTFLSFHYTLPFKLIVFKNIAENTSKYSSYFETMVGFGFFFAPIVLGFVANLGIDVGFLFLASLCLLYLIFYLLKKNKLMIKT